MGKVEGKNGFISLSVLSHLDHKKKKKKLLRLLTRNNQDFVTIFCLYVKPELRKKKSGQLISSFAVLSKEKKKEKEKSS